MTKFHSEVNLFRSQGQSKSRDRDLSRTASQVSQKSQHLQPDPQQYLLLFVLLCGRCLKELCWRQRGGVGTQLHSVSLEDFQSHVPRRKIEWTLAPEINTSALLHVTETLSTTWFITTHTELHSNFIYQLLSYIIYLCFVAVSSLTDDNRGVGIRLRCQVSHTKIKLKKVSRADFQIFNRIECVE